MAFDLSTAKLEKPTVSSGFDLSTAVDEVVPAVGAQDQRPQNISEVVNDRPDVMANSGDNVVEPSRFLQLDPANPLRQQIETTSRLAREREVIGRSMSGKIKNEASIRRADGLSSFPDKAGETEAAKNSPELLESGILSGENPAKVAAFTSLMLLTPNPEELSNIMSSMFENIGITQDSGGNFLATNRKTGVQSIINRPGLSEIDIAQGLGTAAAFTPAGRGIKDVTLPALTKLAGRSAATQTGIEGAQSLAGGEFDKTDIALAGIAASLGQVAAEKVLSPFARAAGGKVADSAKAIIEEGKRRGVKILTTDLAPPESFLGKGLQQISEKLGPLGSGSLRADQQRARVEIVDSLAKQIDASVDDVVETSNIVNSLQRGVAKQLERASIIRGEAVKTLNQGGNVDVSSTLDIIDGQINNQIKLRGQADAGLIQKLESLKQDYPGSNFELLKEFRTSLDSDISAITKGNFLTEKAAVPLIAVRKALNESMINFAKKTDKAAAGKWLQSNRLFADGLQKAKDTELKRILKDGTVSPEKVGRMLKAGNLSELKRLNSFLDTKGKASARNAIIRDALEESGFFAGNVNPDRFATALTKGNRQRAIDTFFSGPEKKEIEGITKLLNATRRAQQTKAGTTTGLGEASAVLAPAALANLVGSDPLLLGLFGTTLVASAKAYESKAVRNLLLRLASAPKGSQAERDILNKITPKIVSALQGVRSQQDKP